MTWFQKGDVVEIVGCAGPRRSAGRRGTVTRCRPDRHWGNVSVVREVDGKHVVWTNTNLRRVETGDGPTLKDIASGQYSEGISAERARILAIIDRVVEEDPSIPWVTDAIARIRREIENPEGGR